MKIITPGNIELAEEVKRFSCDKCGCVFEAKRREYTSVTHRNEVYYGCKCPTCGKQLGYIVKWE